MNLDAILDAIADRIAERVLARLGGTVPPAPEAEVPTAPQKRQRKPPTLVRPPGEATPISSALARKILRDRGMR
jgi:hypothetical protein